MTPVPGEKRRFVVDQPGGNLALDLFVLDQHLGALLDETLASSGLTASQYAVYSQLARGPMTPGALSTDLGIRPTTLSGYLAAMERAGHVTKQRNERDGRSWLVALSESGRAKVEECRPALRRTVRAVNGALGSADDVRLVRETLAAVDRAVMSVLRSD